MAFNIKALCDKAYELNVSDIHLVQDDNIVLRIDGKMRPVGESALTHQDMIDLLANIMPKTVEEDLKIRRGADFAYQPDDRMRFRVSAYFERERLRLVMRLIKIKILTIDDLGLPPIIKEITTWHRGLILLTGITGSGKSTTLAAMLNEVNASDRRCIITIEDPIEMVHPNLKSLVSQREVGRDIESFRAGLVQALRQDPDVILIGEMRDPDTISTSLRAAETGHYVFSTMHTTNALHTIERILSEFPEGEHALLREQLANNLRATITQRLVRRTGGKGRAAALEIMVVNAIIKKLMLEDKIPSIATIIKGRQDGMCLFDQHLADMVRDKTIEFDEALEHVEDEYAFARYVKGKSTAADKGGILGG